MDESEREAERMAQAGELTAYDTLIAALTEARAATVAYQAFWQGDDDPEDEAACDAACDVMLAAQRAVEDAYDEWVRIARGGSGRY